MTSNHDAGLDEVKVYTKLPALAEGEYVLSFQSLEHSSGAKGVFDIVEAEVVSSKGKAPSALGTRTKIWFQRDARGPKKTVEDKNLARFLLALNGGQRPDSVAEFADDLRTNPEQARGTKFGLRLVPAVNRDGHPYFKKEFSTVQ